MCRICATEPPENAKRTQVSTSSGSKAAHVQLLKPCTCARFEKNWGNSPVGATPQLRGCTSSTRASRAFGPNLSSTGSNIRNLRGFGFPPDRPLSNAKRVALLPLRQGNQDANLRLERACDDQPAILPHQPPSWRTAPNLLHICRRFAGRRSVANQSSLAHDQMQHNPPRIPAAAGANLRRHAGSPTPPLDRIQPHCPTATVRR
jgi:hypothetical protein